jgi:hypothetical protein
MTKTKPARQYTVQSVAEAEAVLADLQDKRQKLIAFGQELAATRRERAYKAHIQDGDGILKRDLEHVIAAISINDGMLVSIAEAVGEAETKLMLAKAYAADVAAQAKAASILEIVGALKEAGVEMDAACRTLHETGKVLVGLLSQLRAAGISSPTHDQLDVLGDQALRTAILDTPWGKRYERLAPNQRRSFRDWSTAGRNRSKCALSPGLANGKRRRHESAPNQESRV